MNLRIKRKSYILASWSLVWYLISSLMMFLVIPPYTLENFGHAMIMALGIPVGQVFHYIYQAKKKK